MNPTSTPRQTRPSARLPDGDAGPSKGNPDREAARAAVAEFLHKHRLLIQRRLRRKLACSSSCLFDSEDLFSTIARRIDQELVHDRFLTLNERQLWVLIHRIAENYIADKARAERPRRAAHRPLHARYRLRERQTGQVEQDDPRQALDELVSRAASPPEDRQLLGLRLLGAPFSAIAEILEATEGATRQRWARLVRRLREQVRKEGG